MSTRGYNKHPIPCLRYQERKNRWTEQRAHFMASPDSNERLPSGFILEHNVASQDVWEAIEKWLSTDMLPSCPAPLAPIAATTKTEKNNVTAEMSNTNEKPMIKVPIPWETGSQMQHRKIAQFGNCKYDYLADIAVACDGDEFNSTSHPIPEYIRQVLLHPDKIDDSEKYTQCIINLYEGVNEIPWHVDHEYFGERVLVYTFGEERPLLFRKKKKCDNSLDGYIYAKSYPRHCSMYLLKGEARKEWEHSVPSGLGQRVSITFRSWQGPREFCK
ncbi:hypothetical protein ACHAXS_006971 [Conticribra weissflogii]